MVFSVRDVGLGWLRVMETIGRGLNAINVRLVNEHSTTRLEQYSTTLGFREWLTIMILFLCLHNSCLSLSWLLNRSYMPIFKALKKLMLSLRKTQHMRMGGAVESDEVYVTAGLKSRNNSELGGLGGSLDVEVLRGVDRGGRISQQSSYSLGGVVWKTIFHQEMLSLKPKIIGRHVLEGSTIYTDFFKSYLSLSEAGYRHEAVNHSDGEWVRGECHINGCGE
jgi:hypothetical protein